MSGVSGIGAESPAWLADLIDATMDYAADIGAFIMATMRLHRIGLLSGADHELDYYGGSH